MLSHASLIMSRLLTGELGSKVGWGRRLGREGAVFVEDTALALEVRLGGRQGVVLVEDTALARATNQGKMGCQGRG